MSKAAEINNSCLFCTKETSNEDKDCTSCHKKFHQSCIPKSTMIDSTDWKCEVCLKPVDKSRSHKSKSVYSKSSKSSSRTSALLLQRLEEEKKMKEESLAKELELEERQIALEKTKLSKQRAINEEYIRKKYEVIAEDGSCRRSVVSECDKEDLNRKRTDITNWVQQQNQNKEIPLDPNANPFIPPPQPITSTGHSMNNNSRTSREQLASRNFMGKLPTFSGEANQWPMFISHYERSTELCGFTPEENAVRLQGCLTGRALDIVGPMLTMPGTVDEVIATLRRLFGRPETILQELLSSVRLVKTLKDDDMKSLIEFSVKVNTICLTIQQGGLVDHLSNPCLVSELVQKLPSMLQIFWSGHKATLQKESCLLLVFNTWLKTYFDIACDIEATTITATSKAEVKPTGRNKAHFNFHAAKGVPKKQECVVCGQDCSKVTNCPVFKKCSVEDRWKCAKAKRLCFTCLEPHIYWFCDEKKCSIKGCGLKHNNLLHEDRVEPQRMNLQEEANNIHRTEAKTMFRILPVKIYNKEKFAEVLAFIDEGSSSTLIDSDILSSIDAEGEASPLCLKWTGDVCRTEYDSQVLHGLQISAFNSSKRFSLQMVRSVSNLDLPAQELTQDEIEKYAHTTNLPIMSYAKAKPKLLLGLNNIHIGTTLKLSEGKLHEPIAAKTRIGWTMYGPSIYENDVSINMHICDGDLHNLVKDHFNLENIGVVKSEMSAMPSSERKALDMLIELTNRKGDRFECGLLWRFPNAVLPDSLPMATRRWKCLERRFSKEPQLKLVMQQQIEDYERKGYVKKLSYAELNEPINKVWYLPIFPVTNPNKPGKVRMVWDAAAEIKGVSLNHMLFKGPDQLSSLIGVLFRFREFQTAVCGDIEQMFHRILMKRDDQDCQRFLWRNNSEEHVSVYRMTVLTFGASCSPSTAQFVKNKNADEYSHLYPEAAEAIRRNHYVDDYLDSFTNSEKAERTVKEVSLIHSKAGFNIRNWLSNSKEILQSLDGSSLESSKNITNLAEGIDKVLGMWWCTASDSFTYSLRLEQEYTKIRKPTKREILRTLMRVFDPLGLISHVLVYAKVLLKKVWRSGIGWDEQINEELFEMWQKWISVLQSIPLLKIPRWHSIDVNSSVQLHIFVDASRDAYGAAAYLRIKSGNEICCSLVFAKSKVSPMKEISIPRLELQGAILGVRIRRMVIDEHRLRIESTTFWTDSKTVLCWIKNSELRFKQYVSFRIGEILESSNVNEWRYVPSKENVADKATKWATTPDVNGDSEWFRSPNFLKKGESDWPEDLLCQTTEEVINIHSHCEDVSADPIHFEKFSSWNRVLRAIAIAKRFLNRLRKKDVSNSALTSAELIDAETSIYKLIQREVFPVEISDLIETGKIQKVNKNSPLRKLCPFVDEMGILRMDSRLREAELDYDMRFPVILPKDHHITRLLVHYYHIRYHHDNKETVINELRQKYRIPKIRVVVNSVRNRCQKCKNDRAKPKPPLMSCLPRCRVTLQTRPFTFTGVDLFGPMFVVEGRKTLKRWAMLFTCLTVRAVHIEVVHSLSTDACILSTMRFMSLRGSPRQIFSDNGTNFRGTSNEIKQFMLSLDKDRIERTFNSSTTEWVFIPPAAPHMGGSWERMVQSIKTTLKRIRPKRNPSDEMLLTMMAEACNVVNSRPLTYVSVEDDSQEAITPNHLLLGSSAGVKPMGTLIDDGDQLRKNWRFVEWFANNFWKRFRLEYLPELCGRDKWTEKVNPIEVDDIVYIVDNAAPRNEWPKGRVVEVFKGRNNQVRSCIVQTEQGLYKRPAVRLAVLAVRSKLNPEDNVPGGTVANSTVCVSDKEEE